MRHRLRWKTLCALSGLASLAGCSSGSSQGTPPGSPEAGGEAGGEATDSAALVQDASSLPEAEPGMDAGASLDGEASKEAGPPPVTLFIATGYQNRRIVSFDHTKTWVNDVNDPPNSLDDVGTGVAFGLGEVIVAGHTGIYTSTDAKTWTHLPLPVPQAWPGLGGAAAAFGNDTFVVVSSSDAWTSTDGVTFTKHSPDGGYGALSATHWNGMAVGKGHFFAVGDSNGPGDRKVSEDGVTWHDYVQDAQAWGGVAFGQGVFVAVGRAGRRVWTTDGVTLNDVSNATLGDLGGVAFGGGTFLVSGTRGAATSTDGKTWTTIAGIPGVSSYGEGLFLTNTWASNVLTSPTGAKWTTVFSGASNSPALARVTWGQVRGF